MGRAFLEALQEFAGEHQMTPANVMLRRLMVDSNEEK